MARTLDEILVVDIEEYDSRARVLASFGVVLDHHRGHDDAEHRQDPRGDPAGRARWSEVNLKQV